MPSLGTLKVNQGTVGLAAIDFGEDVSMCSMTATVYTTPPVNGQGGTPLFTYPMQTLQAAPPGETDPASYFQAIPLQAKDTAAPTPVALYGRIDVVYPGQANDLAQIFSFKVDGR